MANTYNFIGKTVLTSNQSAVTFSNIPATYTDLIFFIRARQTGAHVITNFQMFLNNGQSTGYYAQSIYSPTTATAFSFNESNGDRWDHMYCNGPSSTSDIFTNTMMYINNYSSTTQHKMVLTQATAENFATQGLLHTVGQKWAFNAAVNRVDFDGDGANQMVSGTSIYVYGI